jgi:hypothetical protein
VSTVGHAIFKVKHERVGQTPITRSLPEAGLGSLGREGDRSERRETIRGDGVIAPMTVAAARFSLFLDVCDLAARRHLAVPADDASAGECGEAEKSNETHIVLQTTIEQTLCR